MRIKGLEGLTIEDINHELNNGAKFVLYQYTISIILMTFRRPSDIYFLKSHENRVTTGWMYSLITFFLGWWGFPWGPIYSIGSLFTNLGGGKDVTIEVLNSLNQNA
jgi:hypothetical protein